jgi:hypothetical protein
MMRLMRLFAVGTSYIAIEIPEVHWLNRPLKNYLRCRCGVKNRLKMLIYHA